MIAASVASARNRVPASRAARPRVVSILDAPAHLPAREVRSANQPDGFDAETLRELDTLFGNHLGVKKREVLYRATAPFRALYAIRLGTFKTMVLSEDGREQIVGYHMRGDVLGLDGIGNDQHACEAVALEDSEVCCLPFAQLDDLACGKPVLRSTLYRLMSRNLLRGQDMLLLLGSLSAEERLAVFLLDLAERSRRGGYSASELLLRMTREEIGSFLGLKLETVSRVFSRLHGDGLIQVQGRAVKLLDAAALRHLAGQSR